MGELETQVIRSLTKGSPALEEILHKLLGGESLSIKESEDLLVGIQGGLIESVILLAREVESLRDEITNHRS